MSNSGWSKKKVRDLIHRHMSGPSPTCEERTMNESSEWGLLKTTAVTWRGWNAEAHKVPPKIYWNNEGLQVKAGDVIVTKAGPRERVGVVVYVDHSPPHLMVSGKMIGLRPNTAVFDGRVLAVLLSSDRSQRYLDARTTGMADSQLNFANDLLLNMEVNVPPDKDCPGISGLAAAFDGQIGATEALIEKHQQIKAGLMHDLFTRGIGADGKLRPPREQAPEQYKRTPIGWIPKKWSFSAFGNRIDVIDPNPSHRYPIEVEDGYPICSTENFSGDDGFDFVRSKRVPEETYLSQNSRCKFGPTDVISARKGKIGMARRYGKDKKVFSHTVVVMKPLSKIVDANWVLWLSRSDWLLKAIEVTMNTNSGVPTLGIEFIKGVMVPFPPTDEQVAMHEALESVSAKVESESSRKRKLSNQKCGLMRDLLTGQVQVNVEQPEAALV